MPDSASVQPNSYLTLHYRVALASEAAIDSDVVSTFGDRPATLQLGCGQLAAPLEACLIGLQTGERASFELAPGEAYGLRNPDLVQRISRAALDAESESGADYQLGELVEFTAPGFGPGGPKFSGVLKELNADYALLDFNHPLAGQPIRFEVEIIGVL